MILLSTLLFAVQEPALVVEFPYRRWSAAAESRVGFRGDSTLHGFSGECARLAAELHADLDALGATAGGSVWFQARDLTTGKEDRDENMWGDLEADLHPTISFRLDRLDGVLPAGAGQATAAGDFLIHGVARARTFPVEIERLAAGRVRVRGSLRFLQTDHGIEPHSTLGLVNVHDEVEVWFDLSLTPVEAAMREGARRPVSVRLETQVRGAEVRAEGLAWSLWQAADTTLLCGGDEWWLVSGAPARLAPARGARLPAADDAEMAFADARTRLAALEERLAALPAQQRARSGAKLEEAIARLRESLAEAPAEGEAEVARDGDVVEIRLGGRAWARFEGLAGAEAFPAACAEMPQLPRAVRAALRTLRGVPRRAELRTATESGTRTWRLEIGAPAPARLPEWALDAGSWALPHP